MWFSRQNAFEWKFNPLAHPQYAGASEVKFVEPQDVVLAVSLKGDAAAYPVRQLAYHHLVQDVVGGVCRSSSHIERSVTPVWCGARWWTGSG